MSKVRFDRLSEERDPEPVDDADVVLRLTGYGGHSDAQAHDFCLKLRSGVKRLMDHEVYETRLTLALVAAGYDRLYDAKQFVLLDQRWFGVLPPAKGPPWWYDLVCCRAVDVQPPAPKTHLIVELD